MYYRRGTRSSLRDSSSKEVLKAIRKRRAHYYHSIAERNYLSYIYFEASYTTRRRAIISEYTSTTNVERRKKKEKKKRNDRKIKEWRGTGKTEQCNRRESAKPDITRPYFAIFVLLGNSLLYRGNVFAPPRTTNNIEKHLRQYE